MLRCKCPSCGREAEFNHLDKVIYCLDLSNGRPRTCGYFFGMERNEGILPRADY